MSNLESVLSRAPCVRGHRAVCPQRFRRQKRSQSVDNGRLCRATQLRDADASFSERVNRSPPNQPTGLYWKLYNKAVGRKCAPQVDKEVQQLLSRGAFNTSVPWPHHCLSHCRQSQKLMKICAKVNIDRGKFFYPNITSTLVSVWGMRYIFTWSWLC